MRPLRCNTSLPHSTNERARERTLKRSLVSTFLGQARDDRGVDDGLRRAHGGRPAQEEGQREVRLRLRHPRLHDLHPPRLRHRCDERGFAVHQGGPEDLRRSGGGPDGHPERVLAHRLLRGGADVRLDRAAVHHRVRGRHLLRGRARHGLLRQLRHAHVRPLRGRHRRGLRAHDRARVHGRGVPGLRPRLPHLLPGGLHQLRHPPGLRLQLRLLPPLAPPGLARHARHRGRTVRAAGLHGARHAGVAPVARHEGPPGRCQGRPGQDLGHARGGRGAPGGHQGRRGDPPGPGRRHRGGAQEREQRGEAGVEGAHPVPDLGHAAHSHLRDRHPLLPAGVGHRRRGALQPARVQERRHHQREPAPGHHLRRRGHQDGLHPGGHVPPGPHRQEAAAAEQHGRHDRVARGPRRGAHRRQPAPGRADPVGHRALHPLHPGLRGLLLHRARAHHVGLQLRDLPAARARAGLLARRGRQPPDQWGHLHDLHLALQGHHHRRRLLPLRRDRLARLGLLLHLPPGDPRADAGGHERALRQHGHAQAAGEQRHRRRRRRQGEEGGNGGHELIDRLNRKLYARSRRAKTCASCSLYLSVPFRLASCHYAMPHRLRSNVGRFADPAGRCSWKATASSSSIETLNQAGFLAKCVKYYVSLISQVGLSGLLARGCEESGNAIMPRPQMPTG